MHRANNRMATKGDRGMKKVIIEHSPFFVCKCRKCACEFEYTHDEVQKGFGSTYVVSCPVCNSYNTHSIENQPKRKRRK